jgi:P27 family predicted phage terminase small subunit
MRGPAPIPTAIKAAEGNPGKRRLNHSELLHEPEAPPCPRWLDARGRKEFHKLLGELIKMKVLREVDQIQLANLCDAYSILITAREALAKLAPEKQLLVKTPKGAVQQNPLLSVVNTQRQIISRLAAEFGLSPSARARLTLEEEPFDAHAELERLLSGPPEYYKDDPVDPVVQ